MSKATDLCCDIVIEATTPQETFVTAITMYVRYLFRDYLLNWMQTTGIIETNESTYFCPKGSSNFGAACFGC